MRGRKPERLVLKPKDVRVLQDLLNDGQTPWHIARRAQILLYRTNPEQRVVLLGQTVEQDRTTIWRVCERYRQGGLDAALQDAPRAGRPRPFSPHRARGDCGLGLSGTERSGEAADALVAA